MTVEAVYEDDIFKPVGAVALANKQPVRLTIEELDQPKLPFDQWIEKASNFREQMRTKCGTFPDNTIDIAADRMRDV
jgi:predicted DNA-binding antitoxin AbrB/MazE fold protein